MDLYWGHDRTLPIETTFFGICIKVSYPSRSVESGAITDYPIGTMEIKWSFLQTEGSMGEGNHTHTHTIP